MASVAKPITIPKAAAPLPAPNVDFYELAGTLPDEEQAVLKTGADGRQLEIPRGNNS
jgi:hypothetical protein